MTITMSELTLESFELALLSADCRPTRNGNRIQAFCPICSGKTKSKELSVTKGDEVSIVANCFSCGDDVNGQSYYKALLNELSISPNGNDLEDSIASLKKRYSSNAKKRKRSQKSLGSLPPEAIEAIYPYQDSKGTKWTKVRLSPLFRKNGPKFLVARKEPDGSWKLAKKPKDAGATLYRLQDLTDDLRPVWLCEGERDCDNLWNLGVPAVSVPNGANSWNKEHADLLRERSIMIAGDNDEAGEKLNESASKDLIWTCRTVRFINWPDDSPTEYDISDHIESGATYQDFEALWSQGNKHGRCTLADLQIAAGNIQWAWDQRIAQGEGLGIVAIQAEGKTLLALWLANHFVTGRFWPDMTRFKGKRGPALLIETEAKIRSHLKTLGDWGIDMQHFTMPMFEPGDTSATANLHNGEHLAIIERELAIDNYGVMVVDSINGGIFGDENDARRQSITRNLVRLGQKYQVTVIIVAHTVKRLKKGEPPQLRHVRGTSGMTQSLSNIQGLWSPDSLDTKYRGLIPLKYSHEQWPGDIGFTMKKTGLGPWGAMKVPDESDKDKGNKMMKFIKDYIQNNGGRALASDIKREIAAKFNLKPNTVESYASRHWRHFVKREKDEIDGKTYWSLRGLISPDQS